MDGPVFRPIADHAILVDFGDSISPTVHEAVLRLDQAQTAAPFAGFTEAVPAFVNLLADFDPSLTDHGIEIAGLDRSTVFADSADDGLQLRTAWAGSGDGVLFYDGDGKISGTREYVFTEWDPTVKDDMAALRARGALTRGRGGKGLDYMEFWKWGGKGLTGGAVGRPIGMGRREAGVRGVFGAVVCPAVVGGRRGVAGRWEDGCDKKELA